MVIRRDEKGRLRNFPNLKENEKESKIKSDASAESSVIKSPFSSDVEIEKFDLQKEPDWKLTEEQQAKKRGISVEKWREQKMQLRRKNMMRSVDAWKMMQIANDNYKEYEKIKDKMSPEQKAFLRDLKTVKNIDYSSKNGQEVGLGELLNYINKEDQKEFFAIESDREWNEELGKYVVKIPRERIFAESMGWEIDENGKVKIPAGYVDDVKFPVTINGKKFNDIDEIKRKIEETDLPAKWRKDKKKSQEKFMIDTGDEFKKNALWYFNASTPRDGENALKLFLQDKDISQKDKDEIIQNLNLIKLGKIKAQREEGEKTKKSIKDLLVLGDQELELQREDRAIEMYGGIKDKPNEDPDTDTITGEEVLKQLHDKSGNVVDISKEWDKEFGKTDTGVLVKGRLETPAELIEAQKEVRYPLTPEQSLEEQRRLPISNLMGDGWDAWSPDRRRKYLNEILTVQANSKGQELVEGGVDNVMNIIDDAVNEYEARGNQIMIKELKNGEVREVRNTKQAVKEFIDRAVKQELPEDDDAVIKKIDDLSILEQKMSLTGSESQMKRLAKQKQRLIDQLDAKENALVSLSNPKNNELMGKTDSPFIPESLFNAMLTAEGIEKGRPKTKFTQDYSQDYLDNYKELYGVPPPIYAGKTSGMGTTKNVMGAVQPSESARVKIINEETEKLDSEAFTNEYYNVVKNLEKLKRIKGTLKGTVGYTENEKEIGELEDERERLRKEKRQYKTSKTSKNSWNDKKYLSKLRVILQTKAFQNVPVSKKAISSRGTIYDLDIADEYDPATGRVRKNVIRRIFRRNGELESLTNNERDAYIRRYVKSTLSTAGISGKESDFLFKVEKDKDGNKVISLKTPDELAEMGKSKRFLINPNTKKAGIVVMDKDLKKDLRDILLDRKSDPTKGVSRKNKSGLDGLRFYANGRPIFSEAEIVEANTSTRYREKTRSEKKQKERAKSNSKAFDNWLKTNKIKFKDESSKKAYFEVFRKTTDEVIRDD